MQTFLFTRSGEALFALHVRSVTARIQVCFYVWILRSLRVCTDVLLTQSQFMGQNRQQISWTIAISCEKGSFFAFKFSLAFWRIGSWKSLKLQGISTKVLFLGMLMEQRATAVYGRSGAFQPSGYKAHSRREWCFKFLIQDGKYLKHLETFGYCTFCWVLVQLKGWTSLGSQPLAIEKNLFSFMMKIWAKREGFEEPFRNWMYSTGSDLSRRREGSRGMGVWRVDGWAVVQCTIPEC